MICLLFFIASFVNPFDAYATHYKIVEKMEQLRIAPDVIDRPPTEFMEVQFRTGKMVKLGTIIPSKSTKLLPKYIQWKKEKYALHCVCLLDAQAKNSTTTHPGKQWLNWLVVNIRDNKADTGDTLSNFIGSFPSKGTGLHRYVFLAYKQPNTLTINDPSLQRISDSGRGNFSIREFAQKYKLGEPIAGNFYLTEWDKSVPFLEQEVTDANYYEENSNATIV